jgi:hypothetical protein
VYFYFFLVVSFIRTGSFNSIAQLLARDRRAVLQRAQLGPDGLMGCEPRSQSYPGKDRDK